MKRIFSLFTVLVCTALFTLTATSCSRFCSKPASSKTLIVYYTWSQDNNTRKLAQAIHALLPNATLYEIKPQIPYPTEYNEVLKVGQDELKAEKGRPIQPLTINLKDYSTILLGTPIWFGTYSVPVKTFLQENDLSGKQVIPFCTHGNGGPGKYYDDVAKLCPNSTVLKGFNRAGANKTDPSAELLAWLKETKQIQ